MRDSSIAEDILAAIAGFRRKGTLESSLCWDAGELEHLAMFAIATKNQLAALEAENAALAADRDRLDWLQTKIGELGAITLGWEDELQEQYRLYEEESNRVLTNWMTPNGTGLREAIDAAQHPDLCWDEIVAARAATTAARREGHE